MYTGIAAGTDRKSRETYLTIHRTFDTTVFLFCNFIILQAVKIQQSNAIYSETNFSDIRS